MAGLWEFPGGKLEAGETHRCALARELKEELDITVEASQPLLRYRHTSVDQTVVLNLWQVSKFSGWPAGQEGQLLQWVTLGRLEQVNLLEADYPMLDAIRNMNRPNPRSGGHPCRE